MKNFGQPNCVGILERPQKLAFVYRVANDGTVNKISSSDTIDNAYVTAKINNADKSKRWFPSPVINKVLDKRADNNTFEIDGFNVTTSKGVRTMAFTVIDGASPQVADAFESMSCRDMAFYVWSINDQIGGNGAISGELRPFRIKKSTWNVIYNPPAKDGETPAMVMVSFAISELEDDADIRYIDFGTAATDVQVNITDYTGLVDVVMNSPATSISTTGFTVDMDYIYGGQFAKSPAQGFVAADFTLAEVSPTPGAITITSVTEGTGANIGKYVFVIPSQTSADVLRLTFSKSGFEPSGTLDITIP